MPQWFSLANIHTAQNARLLAIHMLVYQLIIASLSNFDLRLSSLQPYLRQHVHIMNKLRHAHGIFNYFSNLSSLAHAQGFRESPVKARNRA